VISHHDDASANRAAADDHGDAESAAWDSLGNQNSHG
jgi:hypothetical protein